MDTVEVLVPSRADLHGRLVAELADLGFESFQELDDAVVAYAPAAIDSTRFRRAAQELADRVAPGSTLRFRIIPECNWSEEWERSATPVDVGRFVILPSWLSKPSSGGTPLWIDPKMSFGTGHHESTRLALRLLEGVVQPGMCVLDAGTGTGILAIAATKLGAAQVVAFDIDEWSAKNGAENIKRNGVEEQVVLLHGDLSSVPNTRFDVAVANISRDVLRNMLPDLRRHLRPRGHILLSGLLSGDREGMLKVSRRLGLVAHRELTENEWWAVDLVTEQLTRTNGGADRDD